jgi:DNA-binding transcriptional MocR family regulator
MTASGSLAERLATAVKEQIATGALPVGSRLASERTLASRHRVSRTTVVAALGSLRDQGWVVTREGSGSYAALPLHAAQEVAAWPPTAPGRGVDLASTDIAAPQPEYQQAAQRAVSRLGLSLRLSGPPAGGLAELREHLADLYSRDGVATTPEQVVITRGAMAGLAMLVRAAHDRRRRVAVEEPTYPGAIKVLRRGRIRLSPVPVDPHDGWSDLAALLERDVDMAFLMPEAHNPTGAVMSHRQRERLLELADRRDLTIVLDDTLREFQWSRTAGPLGSPGILRVGSFAKSVWSGLQVGWVRAPGPVISRLVDGMDPLDVPSLMDQLIVAELLEQGMPHLARRRQALREQRETLLEQLRGVPGIAVQGPSSGLALWCTLSGHDALQFSRAASGAGVDVLSGHLFSVAARQRDAIRVSFTQPPDVLAAGARVLVELAASRQA